MRVVRESGNPTVEYAAEELARCLGRMTRSQVDLAATGEGVQVGVSAGFGVPDPRVDDAYRIDVRDARGSIEGANPRSALLGVYRYLTELGCRWVRPGADGEHVPSRRTLADVRLSEAASYRHRGICIEGSVSVDHVAQLIDWMPKLGFNSYFMQFRDGYAFFDRWYGQQDDRSKPTGTLPAHQAAGYTEAVVREIRKRGLIYHAVGHGWTSSALGIAGADWTPSAGETTSEQGRYFAEIGGKRELWRGIAINTNLCYGNPEARRLVVAEILRYLQASPWVDVLHFWLADGSNNNCECPLCRDTRPADFYVDMLNELDAVLTAERIDARIVFLVYVDLLWPPERRRIRNPDRFVLMFAPITRTYSRSFAGETPPSGVPPFVRNKLTFPSSVGENLAFLDGWQKGFAGDSFVFDYHMIWAHYADLGYTGIARVLSEDVRALRDMGLNGYVSCQVQRAFFPTGLPMTVLGRTLWNRNQAYGEVAADYYESAFGPDAAEVMAYLTKLSALFDAPFLRGEKPTPDLQAAAGFAEVPGALERFAPVIERNLGSSNPPQAKSWFYLKSHAAVCLRYAAACESLARGDRAEALARWGEARGYIQQNRGSLHAVLDVFYSAMVLGHPFGAQG